MNQLDELLAQLGTIKEAMDSCDQTIDALKNSEASVRLEISNFMIDNGIKKKTSPDGKYSASLTTRKSVTIKDKPGMLVWAKLHRQDLLSVDMTATKKEMKNEPGIKQFFQVEDVTGVTVSEVKEKVEIEETPAQFRDRVRAGQELNQNI